VSSRKTLDRTHPLAHLKAGDEEELKKEALQDRKLDKLFCKLAPNMLPFKKISSVFVRKHCKESDARSHEITGFSYEKDVLLSGCPFAPVTTHCMYKSTRYYY
jgi:hypothetical protein